MKRKEGVDACKTCSLETIYKCKKKEVEKESNRSKKNI